MALYRRRVTVSSVEPVEPVEPEEAAPPPAPEAELEEGELPVNSWPPPAPPQLVIPTLAGPLPTPHTGFSTIFGSHNLLLGRYRYVIDLNFSTDFYRNNIQFACSVSMVVFVCLPNEMC